MNAALPSNAPAASNGFSQSGRPVPYRDADAAALRADRAALIDTDPAAKPKCFEISGDGKPSVPVHLSAIDVAGLPTNDPAAFRTGPAAGVKTAVESYCCLAFG